MTRWELMEEWLFEHEDDRFKSRHIKKAFKVDGAEASRMIQAYLDAQRQENSKTLFVLKREGRTSNAWWTVGQRTVDARVIGGTLFEDVSTKVRRAFAPDMRRLAARNPRAARYVDAKIGAVVGGALKVLAASVDQYYNDDDEE